MTSPKIQFDAVLGDTPAARTASNSWAVATSSDRIRTSYIGRPRATYRSRLAEGSSGIAACRWEGGTATYIIFSTIHVLLT
jgi:hypothetical protein